MSEKISDVDSTVTIVMQPTAVLCTMSSVVDHTLVQ